MPIPYHLLSDRRFQLQTEAPHKSPRAEPTIQVPTKFGFHVVICSNVMFYEEHFLKLPQHNENICGSRRQYVTAFMERLYRNLISPPLTVIWATFQ